MQNYGSLAAKLPLSAQSFAEIRENQLLYVDKTSFVYAIARSRSPKFLSRPRRFGKSTLLSTLEELFLHGVKPYAGHDSFFKGLAIERLWQDEGTYHVLRLDLLKIVAQSKDAEDFENCLCRYLIRYAKSCNIELKREAGEKFHELLEILLELLPHQMVLLVDEYDAPLAYFWDEHDKTELNRISSIISGIFIFIKTNTRKLRLSFVTGITRYKDSYLFTEGNSILDLSQASEFGTACGYTRAELQTYFCDYLTAAAQTWFKLPAATVTASDRERVIDLMARWYDGYCFSEKGDSKVFSTWSVLSFFHNPGFDLRTYWYDNAGLPFLIRKALSLDHYQQILATLESNKIEVASKSFLNPASLDDMNPAVLLFQSGFLTLAEPYVKDGFALPWVSLRLPNYELEYAFISLLSTALKRLHPEIGSNYRKLQPQFLSAVQNQELASFVEKLNLLFNKLAYDGDPVGSEAAFSAFIQVFVENELNVQVQPNRHEGGGRPDLVFTVAGITVVIECKFVPREGSASVCDRELLKAVQQMQQRLYGKTAHSADRLWRIALVFWERERQITHYACADGASAMTLPDKC